MSTSGTYGATELQSDLIDEAFERCGIAPSSLTADHLRAAQRSIRYALGSWEARDFASRFRMVTGTLTIVAGSAEQAVPANIIAFTSLVRGALVVDQMTAREYNELPNQLSEGDVVQVWHDTSRSPRLMCWMVPTTDDAITYTALTMFQDPGALANELDIAHAHKDAFAAELAARLAVKYAPTRVAGLRGEADAAFTFAKQFSRNRVAAQFRPGRRR